MPTVCRRVDRHSDHQHMRHWMGDCMVDDMNARRTEPSRSLTDRRKPHRYVPASHTDISGAEAQRGSGQGNYSYPTMFRLSVYTGGHFFLTRRWLSSAERHLSMRTFSTLTGSSDTISANGSTGASHGRTERPVRGGHIPRIGSCGQQISRSRFGKIATEDA